MNLTKNQLAEYLKYLDKIQDNLKKYVTRFTEMWNIAEAKYQKHIIVSDSLDIYVTLTDDITTLQIMCPRDILFNLEGALESAYYFVSKNPIPENPITLEEWDISYNPYGSSTVSVQLKNATPVSAENKQDIADDFFKRRSSEK